MSATDPTRMQAYFAKMVSVFLAFAFYAFYQSTASQTRIFNLPLQLSFQEGTSVLKADVVSVSVYVRGPEKKVRQIKSADLDVYVDTESKIGTGEGVFPIFLERNGISVKPQGISYTIFPDKVHVKYEKSLTKDLLVKVPLIGTPRPGFEPSVKAFPSKISLTGPASIISAMSEVNTFPIDTSGYAQPFTMYTNVDHPVNTTVQTNEKIEVMVDFTRINSALRLVTAKPTVVNLRENLDVVSEMPDVSINLQELGSELTELDPKNLRLVLDCAEIEDAGDYMIPVQLIAPNGNFSAELNPSSVAVKLERK